MNKILKFFGIITLIFCIGIIACEDADNNKRDDYNDPNDPYYIDISAVDFVGGMRVGWNLGNTFDAVGGGNTIPQIESAWCGTVTTKENIDAIKDAGFNLIRIPVSWSKVADAGNNYKIRDDWMMRLMEVVLWALDNDMYVIINTHHDSGDQGTIFRFQDTYVEQSLTRFGLIWEQIAEFFKYFDEKLIFEPLNEPRTPSNDWTGNAGNYYNLNRHYQLFADIVRATGAYNKYRFFLFNTYAASAGMLSMNGLILPDDPAEDKHIVSYHAYVPGNFAFGGATGLRNTTVNWNANGADATAITDPMDRYYNRFVKFGIPVIIGEFGATNKNNEDARARWVEYYTRSAWDRGMRVIWWDNAKTAIPENGNNNELFGLLDRRTNEVIFPKIMQGLLQGSITLSDD